MRATLYEMKEKNQIEEHLLNELAQLRRRVAELEAAEAEHKRVEAGMERAAKEWRTAFDAISDWISIHDRNFRITRVNLAFAKAFEMSPKKLIGQTCYHLLHRANEPCPQCPHQLVFETGKPHTAEFFAPHLDAYLEISASPIFSENGDVISSVHIVKNITQRKRMEEEIIKFKTISDQAGYGVSISSLQGKLIYVNESYARMHGYTVDELIGKHFSILYTEEQARAAAKRREKICQKGSAVDETWHKRKDGTIFPALSTGTVVRDEEGKPLYIASTHIDITERKKMEEQLMVTDRLASVGELVSGVAHELNNPLTGIIGFAELLLGKDVPKDIREDIKIIHREAKRTAKVVRSLLTFARKHETRRQPVNINHEIRTVLELRAYEQKVNRIRVNTHFAPALPEVMADSFQLQQVFLNITINAEHFMLEAHGGGTLTITTEQVGDTIRATFADDGPGIAPEHLGHLFDPFFTTKEVGRGTGLGLSICHGIITEHGGRIYAESELGKGATFIIELPVSKGGNEEGVVK